MALFCLNCSLSAYANDIQKVMILADESYPPYSFLENGVLKGIYIDIIKESAKLMSSKYEVSIIAVPWKRGLLEIKEGRALAILAPYIHQNKRPYIWPYSIAIMTEHVVAHCHKGVPLLEYLEQSNLKISPPINIGINAGYLILNKELQQAKNSESIMVRENKSTLSNIMKLYSKRIDCYLNDRLSTEWEMSQIPKQKSIHFNHIHEMLSVMSKTAHIGYTNNKNHKFPFKNDFVIKMDHAISTIMSSKKYTNIIESY